MIHVGKQGPQNGRDSETEKSAAISDLRYCSRLLLQCECSVPKRGTSVGAELRLCVSGEGGT